MTAPRPLSGRRIVVTRARAQARTLSALLEVQGAEVIEIPTIRITPLHDYGRVDQAIERLAEYQWIVFTSRNAVIAFMDRLTARGRSAAALGGLRVASIGPATARALETYGIQPQLAPQRFVAEALVEAFAGQHRGALRGARVLLPRALDARTTLPEGLRALGAAVDVVPVYRVEPERQQDPLTVRRLLRETIDAVTFTSPSTVRNFLELLGHDAARALGGSLVACIGPVTAAAARECGVAVGLVAETYTIPGLVEALLGRLGRVGLHQRSRGAET